MSAISGLDAFRITREPHYQPVGDEIALFEAAHAAQLPLLLKGPTGCGKTRFVEYMAWKLGRPLITVACHEDLTAADLVGRFLLDADGTVWQDGPLAQAVRFGAICYLDEIVEARADTTVVIHPLSDARRALPLERRNELVPAHTDFQLVISYNPGYQSLAKSLKSSTLQRFAALEFNWPEATLETSIVANESGIDTTIATRLVQIAMHTRQLAGSALDEGASTRMLVHAARLICGGISFARACDAALIVPLSDDAEVRATLRALVDTCV